MATLTISLPEPMKDWIEAKVRKGDYASTSDYVRDLVRRDRQHDPEVELTIEDLRRIVDESRASGLSQKSVTTIFAEVLEEAKSNGIADE